MRFIAASHSLVNWQALGSVLRDKSCIHGASGSKVILVPPLTNSYMQFLRNQPSEISHVCCIMPPAPERNAFSAPIPAAPQKAGEEGEFAFLGYSARTGGSSDRLRCGAEMFIPHLTRDPSRARSN